MLIPTVRDALWLCPKLLPTKFSHSFHPVRSHVHGIFIWIMVVKFVLKVMLFFHLTLATRQGKEYNRHRSIGHL